MAKLSIRADAPLAASAALPAKTAGRPGGRVGPASAAARRRRRIFGRLINAKGLAVFTRQLATLVRAGMPILRSLEVLARQ